MLADADITALDSHLGTIVRENQQHHDNLQNLLSKFQELLESYNSLKSDYEEEKAGRERYKRLARGQFKEHLIKAGSDGGITAARLMHDSIRDLLHDRLGSHADQCRIMVRIYANVLGLSKALARSGLVGNEARSLSPFVANLTSSQDLFDFVDAGDKKEAADYKIREMFRMFADNNQCKHIFFAGCHDAGYLNLLTPYRGRADRLTLLKAAGFHNQYNTLDLPLRELPEVFMSTPFAGVHARESPSQSQIQSQIILPSPSRPVCKHYQKGICRYGSTCIKLHIQPNQQISKVPDDTTSIFDRENSSPSRTHEYYAANLPTTTDPFYGTHVPINKTGERIDTYCAAPSPEARDQYSRRARVHRPCNNFHLAGHCDTIHCEFDHGPIDINSRGVMAHILRQLPCGAGLTCRSMKCFLGHHCQKDGCRGTKCRFNRHAHMLDLHIAKWVPALEKEDVVASSVSDASEEASPVDSDNTFAYSTNDTLS
ncbi:hypothetical protein ASPACDRAFT_29631 [Aspergillus aculeatus ATCC 16872]|uniref:C3H1-type domain-containing protein n=1 Tax=Aspergillus aculeatus (strain ATCC 16872 / CBS 172.66 / WB 5094) TaxID=690307 RepID=A0A1L9WSM6_ASPA1|nr:uncharacterized protein ASPACDRAFT_29631 [Aspergillus aculeatus ATCC 16872]OJJ99112.1 hypothetical protein ASPACDRAFT_29631 [Aspergillus aculeatus ATCC 16872]